jgi:hypothetical protein
VENTSWWMITIAGFQNFNAESGTKNLAISYSWRAAKFPSSWRSPWRSANSMSSHLTFLMIINLTPIFVSFLILSQIFHHILRQKII